MCFIDFTQILVTLVCIVGTYTYYSESKAKKDRDKQIIP